MSHSPTPWTTKTIPDPWADKRTNEADPTHRWLVEDAHGHIVASLPPFRNEPSQANAQRITDAVNACDQIPNPILHDLAQHPGRLYAIAKWFKHLSTYTTNDTTGTVCALCHTIDSHDDNCPLPAILQTLDPPKGADETFALYSHSGG